MYKNVIIPYAEQTKELKIPQKNLAWVTAPKNTPAVPDLREAVVNALRSPIKSPGLDELVRRYGRKTVILADDSTRSTPQATILPILLDELNSASVSDSDITVIVALGMHRPMSREELVAHFGPEVIDRVCVENLSQDPADFAYIGTTPAGVPINVCRRYLESDISIAVGNIIPHMYAGFAGGAKMVQPGITSPETTGKTHMMAGPRVYEILGDIENPVRLEMEKIAVKSGLKFIVNVVLNRDGQVVDVVAGDVVAAHRGGVKLVQEIFTVELDEQPDIIVAGSHPADRDLWQGFKPINNCGMLVKDGGTLILVIPAPEGIAPDHPQFIDLGTTPGDKVLEMVEKGQISDLVAAATYLALDRTRKRVSIILVSDGITQQQATPIGLKVFQSFDSALSEALKQQGSEARIGVITHGADIMGRYREK